jgi:hypothetical protein
MTGDTRTPNANPFANRRSPAAADAWFAGRIEAFIDELRAEAASEAHAVAWRVPSEPASTVPTPTAAVPVSVVPVAPVPNAPVVTPPSVIAPSPPAVVPFAALAEPAIEPWVPDERDGDPVVAVGTADDLEHAFWNDGERTWRDRIPKKDRLAKQDRHPKLERAGRRRLSMAGLLQGGAVVVAAAAAIVRLG